MFEVESAKLFDVRRVSDREWVIYDLRFDLNDARCVVACIRYSDDDDVEVVWLDGRAMPTRYASVDAVMADLTIAAQRVAGGSPPHRDTALPAETCGGLKQSLLRCTL